MTLRWLLMGGLAWLCAGPAFAQPPSGSGCTKTAEVDATSGTAAYGVIREITAQASRVCSVSLIASYATDAWAEVFSSPNTTNPAHAQAVRIAEPGTEARFNSAHQFFGEHGREARFGLGATVVRGRLLVHYQD